MDGKPVWRQAEFRSSTGYKKVSSGEYPVRVDAIGPGTTLLTKTLSFDKKQSYTLLALGQAQPGGRTGAGCRCCRMTMRRCRRINPLCA